MKYPDDIGISVVMPVHNCGQYLQAAVDSILTQSYKRIELLIVDDHSDDGAIENLKTHHDERIRYLHSSYPGIIPALTIGIENARMPLIARMDGDDIAHPERLRQQLDYLNRNPDVDICATQVELFKDSGRIGQGYHLYQNWINQQRTHQQISDSIFIESPLPHPTVLLPKHIFIQLGGYQEHNWPEDYDLWCRAFLAGFRFGKAGDKPLLRWRDYNDRASRRQSRYQKQSFLRCKARYLAQHLARQNTQDCTIWGTGPTGLKLHDYLSLEGLMVEQFYDINPKLKGRTKRDKPVALIDPLLPPQLSSICLIAVSARSAREELKLLFDQWNWQHGQHYIFAA